MVFSRFSSLVLLSATFAAFGCHAQQPASGAPPAATASATLPGTPLTPELARRVEVTLREKANLPPESVVNVGGRIPSEFGVYDTVLVTVTSQERTSRPITFLLSHDGKTLAQLTKFDISADPRTIVSSAGRPGRGGSEAAPVQIVNFDDLECPYCGRLHGELFPALMARYGDKVRIVYKDFPIEQHPWALRAAVDTNCLAAQSTPGYWEAVDYIHAHGSELGADPKNPKIEKTLARASDQLDTVTRQQATALKLDVPKLNACLAKQDVTAVNASKDLGVKLGIEATPTFFINGDKFDGAVSLQFLFSQIDNALRVAGVQPPPPYVAPPSPVTPATGPAATPAGQ